MERKARNKNLREKANEKRRSSEPEGGRKGERFPPLPPAHSAHALKAASGDDGFS